MDEKRQGEIREQQQMERLRRESAARISAMKLDEDKFNADPFSKQMKRPAERKRIGRSQEVRKSAADDLEIIEANRCAIEIKFRSGVRATKIAEEFGIRSLRVLRTEAKRRGWI